MGIHTWPVDRMELTRRIVGVSRLTGSFTLRSGQTADTYFDKYRFESDPELLQAVAAAMVPLIPRDTDLLAGLELGGVPVATALSIASGIPAVFVRKQAKAYGTAKLAEGPDINGRRLLIVEDVVTSGGQIAISAGDLRERGATVTTAVCAIDREQGGNAALAGVGIELRSVVLRHDLDAATDA